MGARKPRPHEFSYYSRGKWRTSQVYIVGWGSLGIVKVGVTDVGRNRFGPFIRRGGQLLHLEAFEGLEFSEQESRIKHALEKQWERAFTCKEEAEGILSGRGAGWTECFKINPEDWGRVLDIAKESDQHSVV